VFSVQRGKEEPNGPVIHPSIRNALAPRGAPEKLGGGRTPGLKRGHLTTIDVATAECSCLAERGR